MQRSKLFAPENRKWWTLASVGIAQSMGALDNTVVNVALPSIRNDLSISVSQLEWVITGYILCFAVLMLTGGKLGDMYGRRRIFMIGLAIFTIASLLCGLSGSAELLIAARVLQGVGAALLIPSTLSIITATFPPAERGTAIGIWSGMSAIALTSGPLVGGLLTEHVGWNWVFYINVPIGVLGIATARIAISESRDRSSERHLDLPGLVSSAVALFALLYALIEGNAYGWTSARIVGLLALAFVAGVTFVMLELRQRLPMLDLTLFRNRIFAGANSVALIAQFTLVGCFFFITLFLQDGLGYSAVESGAAFLPWMLVMIVGSPLTGRMSDRVGSRWLMTAGLTLVTLAMLLFAQVEPGTSYWSIFPAMLVSGIGVSSAVTPMVAAAMSAVRVDKAGVGAGVLNTFRQVGGALGIAVLGAIFASTATFSPGKEGAGTDVFISGIHHVFYAAAVVSAVGALVAATTIRSHAGASGEAVRHPAAPGTREAPS